MTKARNRHNRCPWALNMSNCLHRRKVNSTPGVKPADYKTQHAGLVILNTSCHWIRAAMEAKHMLHDAHKDGFHDTPTALQAI